MPTKFTISLTLLFTAHMCHAMLPRKLAPFVSLSKKVSIRSRTSSTKQKTFIADRVLIDISNPAAKQPRLIKTFNITFPSIPGAYHLEPVHQYDELQEYARTSKSLNQLLVIHPCSRTGSRLMDKICREGYTNTCNDLLPRQEVIGTDFFASLLMTSLKRLLFKKDQIIPDYLKISTYKTFDGTVEIGFHGESDFKRISQFHDDIAFVEVGIREENAKKG